MTNPSTLYRGGARATAPADPRATALLVPRRADRLARDRRRRARRPTGVVDLDGALVTPAFVDAHVHATDTGLALSGLDLSGARSARAAARRGGGVRGGLPADAVVLGHGWDESTWVGPRRRRPRRSWTGPPAAGWCTCRRRRSTRRWCSSALLAARARRRRRRPATTRRAGCARDAHHVVRAIALGVGHAGRSGARRSGSALRARGRRWASRRCTSAAARAPPTRPTSPACWRLAGAARPARGVRVLGRAGWRGAKARELGAVGAGGDLYADGALGSRTAHLREPYVRRSTACGHGYLAAEQVARPPGRLRRRTACRAASTRSATRRSRTVLAGFAAAAATVGLERLRAGPAPHRARRDRGQGDDRAAWSSSGSWRACSRRSTGCGAARARCTRSGWASTRSLESNPMGAMHGVGVALAFGSDSPVTPLDPWGSRCGRRWRTTTRRTG